MWVLVYQAAKLLSLSPSMCYHVLPRCKYPRLSIHPSQEQCVECFETTALSESLGITLYLAGTCTAVMDWAACMGDSIMPTCNPRSYATAGRPAKPQTDFPARCGARRGPSLPPGLRDGGRTSLAPPSLARNLSCSVEISRACQSPRNMDSQALAIPQPR